MLNETIEDPVKRYAHANRFFLRYKKKDCLSVSYNNHVKTLKNPFFDTSNMGKI